MSTVSQTPPAHQAQADRHSSALEPSYAAAQTNEFEYRPVPILAPLSLCLGLLSGVGFMGILLMPIGFIGVIVGLICIVRLKRADGEFGGMWLAVTGLVLSFV